MTLKSRRDEYVLVEGGPCCDPTSRTGAEIDKLRDQLRGWHMTALAIRDAGIALAKTGDLKHYSAMERMYFDASMLGKFTEVYHV